MGTCLWNGSTLGGSQQLSPINMTQTDGPSRALSSPSSSETFLGTLPENSFHSLTQLCLDTLCRVTVCLSNHIQLYRSLGLLKLRVWTGTEQKPKMFHFSIISYAHSKHFWWCKRHQPTFHSLPSLPVGSTEDRWSHQRGNRVEFRRWICIYQLSSQVFLLPILVTH